MDSSMREYDRKRRGMGWVAVGAVSFVLNLIAVDVLAQPGHYHSIRPNAPEPATAPSSSGVPSPMERAPVVPPAQDNPVMQPAQ